MFSGEGPPHVISDQKKGLGKQMKSTKIKKFLGFCGIILTIVGVIPTKVRKLS
jgi:hypothetical protein